MTVSIVLITFNDAGRLPRALASIRTQTLRDIEIVVVDDASTDETPTIVAAAAAEDPRIRSVRLAENSGGCSAPRNAGLAAATGSWVMFCDSDDELERHAAKNLLLAVERADADLGCGIAERIDIETGGTRRWRADLHEPGVLDGITVRPELIADTVSVNKIYRRAWLLDRGITFPEGVLYEDQLFTIRAYAEAERIAVIDQTVYRWYVKRRGDSITQRRHELDNVRSRVAVNRLIDAYLVARPDLEPVKRRKFLAHDLYLYLGSMLDMDDETAIEVIEVLHPYVSGLDLEPAATLRPALRVAIAHLLVKDLEGIRAAMRFVIWAATVDMPIVRVSGRDMWGCEHLRGGPIAGRDPRWWLDVTALRLHDVMDRQARWCHRVDDIVLEGARLTVRGSTVDAFGRLARVTSARVALTSAARVIADLPARWESDGDGGWRWSASGHLRDVDLAAASRGTLSMVLTIDGQRNVMALRMPVAPTLTGSTVRLTAGEFGAIRWQVGAFSTLAQVRRGWRRAVAPVRRAWLALVRRVAGALPASRTVILASRYGIGGQPWALAQAVPVPTRWLAELRPGTAMTWALARARWWCADDEVMPLEAKAAHTRFMLVPGLPIAHLGRDDPDWDITPRTARRPRWVRRWSMLIGPNARFTERLHSATGFAGSTQCAAPLGERVRRDRALARADLGIPSRRLVVVWAPAIEASIDLPAFVDALGDRVLLLVLPDVPVEIPAAIRSSVVDLSDEADRAAVLAAADVLVSDVSPLMWDFAVTGRPIIVHAPNLDAFRSRVRGTYDDLRADGPGPVTEATSELIDEIRATIDRSGAVDPAFAVRYAAFAERGAAVGTVKAAVSAVFGGA